MKNNGQFIILLIVLATAGALSLGLFARDRSQKDLLNINSFPMTLDGWAGEDLEITEKEYDILETRNVLFRNYANKEGSVINLFIVYSETNRSVFHPPEVCLMGGGLNIVNKTREEVDLKRRRIFVNKLCLEEDKNKSLVLYCYKAADLYSDSYPQQQGYFALRQILGRRVPGATIRVSMPVKGDEAASLSTLKNFLIRSIKAAEGLG